MGKPEKIPFTNSLLDGLVFHEWGGTYGDKVEITFEHSPSTEGLEALLEKLPVPCEEFRAGQDTHSPFNFEESSYWRATWDGVDMGKLLGALRDLKLHRENVLSDDDYKKVCAELGGDEKELSRYSSRRFTSAPLGNPESLDTIYKEWAAAQKQNKVGDANPLADLLDRYRIARDHGEDTSEVEKLLEERAKQVDDDIKER